ncbi:MAG: Opine dehydrogenase [Desulfovibrio sp.]
MNIAVLGAGNTGRIMAFDLAQKGAEVRLYTGCAEKADHITRHGLTAEGKLEGTVRVAKATTSMEDAVRGAAAVFVMTTAGGHKPVAEKYAPYAEKDQIVIAFNGNWGAVEFCQALGVSPGDTTPRLLVGETGTQLYIGSATGPGSVFVKQVKTGVSLAMASSASTPGAIERLRSFFPQFTAAANIVETSLSSANAIVHTPVCLFNLSRIELQQDFRFYAEGASASTIDYVEHIDEERVAVMQALGLPTRNMLAILNSFWPDKKDSLYAAIHENVSYQSVPGPKSLDHRFFSEDLPYGIVPLAHLGRELGVATPYIDAMLETFSRFMNRDLFAEGFKPDPALVRAAVG